MTRQPLELGDVLSGRALLALHDVELDALAFGEGLVAVALNRRMMNEAVLLATLWRDKAKALRIVEPLYRAGRTHCGAPKCCVACRSPEMPYWPTNLCIRDLDPHDGLTSHPRRPTPRVKQREQKKALSKCQGPAYS